MGEGVSARAGAERGTHEKGVEKKKLIKSWGEKKVRLSTDKKAKDE